MPSNNEPLVSVVTPAYNGEQYLRECIESVLAQTYANWDYTIVDNCSTDRTLDIAREYAARDSRIRVHSNQSFVRVIENHNIALRQISPQSKYCKVVAADDWIFPECLEKMVRLAEENPSVAIVGSYGLLGTAVVHNGLPYTSTVIPGRELCRRHHLGELYVFGAPTSVLFRSDIVRTRHAFYNESNFLHADTEACYEFLEHHDFGFVHQVLTFRREREGSLTSYSERLNTYLPNILYILTRYGPKYLSEEEFAHELRRKLRVYYRFLGREVFRMRGREFWSLHLKKLDSVGHLSIPRLAVNAASHALDLLLNPKRTAEAVWSRVREVFSGSRR